MTRPSLVEDPYRDWDEREEMLAKFTHQELKAIVFWALHKVDMISLATAKLERTEAIIDIEQNSADIRRHYETIIDWHKYRG